MKTFPKWLLPIFTLQCKLNREGTLADFLPQFATQNADKFGIAICTVDGQRFSIGDVEDPFSLQAIA
jgi:glutaminase